MARGQRKKKKPARVEPEVDLHDLFGAKVGAEMTFTAEVEARLAATDLHQVLAEKKGRKPPTLLEKLRIYPPPQEELDLHGTTGTKAETRVTGFLNAAAALHIRTVRIITGKGLHTEGPAVLPPIVEATLADLKQSGRILHYAWDKKHRERSGAVVVYLK
jgi:DNA-nicking Smr family endonuclease